MRATELLENTKTFTLDDLSELVRFIKANCTKYLAESAGALLYRGTNKPVEVAAIVSTRRDRRPTASTKEEHEVMNLAIQKAGKTANRTNSAFTTGAKNIARRYGSVSVVIPVGDFNYTWSPMASDWYAYNVNFHAFRRFAEKALRGVSFHEAGNATFMTYRHINELLPYLQKLYDLVIETKEIPADDELKEILSDFIVSLFNIHGDDSTLNAAIRSGQEVMISCEEYILVDIGIYESLIEPELRSLTESGPATTKKKAIFMAGSPGSGKSYVANQIAGMGGLKIVDIDRFAEIIAKQNSIDVHQQKNASEEEIKKLYSAAWEKNKKRLDLLTSNGRNILIDGTGKNVQRMTELVNALTELGYDVGLAYVSVSLETALRRNASRPRQVDPHFVEDTWHAATKNLRQLHALFDDDAFFFFKNDDDVDAEKREETLNRVRKFLSK